MKWTVSELRTSWRIKKQSGYLNRVMREGESDATKQKSFATLTDQAGHRRCTGQWISTGTRERGLQHSLMMIAATVFGLAPIFGATGHGGVLSLSVLDGWWIEGCIEEVTGWAIGDHSDAASLYEELEHAVRSRFYQQRDQFVRIIRQAIPLNASHFNTQRMVQEYVVKAYLG